MTNTDISSIISDTLLTGSAMIKSQAAEIERLKAALDKIANMSTYVGDVLSYSDIVEDMQHIAYLALEGK